MSRHRGRARAAGARLAGEPDGRGRRPARVGRRGHGRSCPPAPRPACTRRSSCATAARRGAARASRRPSRNVNGELARRGRRARRRRPGGARRGADRRRRHAEQGPARRERDPRRLARRREAPRRRRRPCRSTATSAARRAHVLPVPMLNVINGGAHAQNSIDLQEFMVVPAGALDLRRGDAGRGRGLPRAEARCCTSAGSRPAVGDEGGFAPDLPSSEAAIEAILEAAERAGHRDTVAIALDPATSEVYRDGALPLRGQGARRLRAGRRSGATCSTAYPIVSLEDGAAEDDWDTWKQLTDELGDRLQLVGDDLFVTNVERLRRGHRRAASGTRS